MSVIIGFIAPAGSSFLRDESVGGTVTCSLAQSYGVDFKVETLILVLTPPCRRSFKRLLSREIALEISVRIFRLVREPIFGVYSL
jgi:hypothetical protein